MFIEWVNEDGLVDRKMNERTNEYDPCNNSIITDLGG